MSYSTLLLMYATYQESFYPPDVAIQLQPQFKQFLEAQTKLAGYRGTLVTQLDPGRYLTASLWDSKEHMEQAQDQLGQMAEELLHPLMTKPSSPFGHGRVVVNDLHS